MLHSTTLFESTIQMKVFYQEQTITGRITKVHMQAIIIFGIFYLVIIIPPLAKSGQSKKDEMILPTICGKVIKSI